jgi:predicted DNA-binding protein with PD1-like motif
MSSPKQNIRCRILTQAPFLALALFTFTNQSYIAGVFGTHTAYRMEDKSPLGHAMTTARKNTKSLYNIQSGPLMAHSVRLEPGADLVSSLLEVALQINSPSLFIMTAVGSLETVTLRLANASWNNNKNNIPNNNKDHQQQQQQLQDVDNGNQLEANHETAEPLLTLKERLEVVSFVGTIGIGGGDSATTTTTTTTSLTKHWHMSVADAQGTVYGGHVMSGTVYTTLELVLGSIGGVQFTRHHDPRTGYAELVVQPVRGPISPSPPPPPPQQGQQQ